VIGAESASPAPDVVRIAHESASGIETEQDAIIAATERIVYGHPGRPGHHAVVGGAC
jgi:hypothetical protein